MCLISMHKPHNVWIRTSYILMCVGFLQPFWPTKQPSIVLNCYSVTLCMMSVYLTLLQTLGGMYNVGYSIWCVCTSVLHPIRLIPRTSVLAVSGVLRVCLFRTRSHSYIILHNMCIQSAGLPSVFTFPLLMCSESVAKYILCVCCAIVFWE